jgi:hypothetical protein
MLELRRPPVNDAMARALVASVAVAIGLTACGRPDVGRVRVPVDRAAVSGAPATGPVDVGRWRIEVSLGRSRTGPLVLRTTTVARAPETSSHPWIQHEVIMRNVGRRSVSLGDTRGSAYVSGPVRRALLGADEGCGYGRSAGSEDIDVGACASYLDAPR